MYEKLNLFNGTILNSQHIAHIEDGIANNSKAVEKNVAVAVETSYNQQTHVITFKVKNALGEIISTSTIDLPTESAIININDIVINGKKYLRFTTVNGSTFDVEMDEMFVNLINEETFSNAIQNINEQISQLQTDVSNSKNDISNLKSFAENTNKSLANLEQTDIITNKRLANLESATLDFIEDSTIAYSKTVPENALPYAEVTKIGGMTRKCKNLFDYNSHIANANQSIIKVIPNKTLYRNAEVGNRGSWNLYDNTDTLIGNFVSLDFSDSKPLVLPSNASYIECTDTSVGKTLYIGYDSDNTYEPYFEGLRSAPVSELVSEGANLIPYPYKKESVSLNGGIFTVESDGGVSASGTPTDYIDIVLYNDKLLSSSIITISMSGVYDNVVCSFDLYNENGVSVYSQAITYGSLTTDISEYPTASKMRIGLKRNGNNCAMSGKVYVMLNKGSTALPYRPYFKRTLPIPEAVRPAHGINENVYDYIEWCEDGTRKKRVKCGDYIASGAENPILRGQNTVGNYVYSIQGLFNYLWIYNSPMLADKYEYKGTSAASSLLKESDNSGVYYSYYNSSSPASSTLYFISSASTIEEFLAELTATRFVYALAEPEVTDISDILTDDNFIEVEGGGSIMAVNEFGYDVPTTINYATDIGE